jgi:hypothetical protein
MDNTFELIQNLWSGYGKLIRTKLDGQSLVIKQIKYPTQQDHPKGWNSNLSHARKIKSYQVEISWYQNYNEPLQEAYSPRYISYHEVDNTHSLILEDLKVLNYISKDTINEDEIKLCIKWLAIFHAKYLGVPPKDLWESGSYWHLETRPDELAVTQDKKLKANAQKVNKKLSSANYKTLIHGDAKLANFLFSPSRVSAVDFQYVGGGVGVKDLAYFLTSIYNEDELFKNAETCLDYYFIELSKALSTFQQKVDFNLLENEWRILYPYAFCDFYRFLKGWSPTHFKLNSYSEYIIKKVLECI